MFGYIRPMISELRVREHELYKSLYCGLCRSMGECICQTSRFTLSYDILFLALVRTLVTNEKISVRKKRCAVHPVKKRNCAEKNSALEYSSRAAAILTYYNIKDDIKDTRGAKALKYKALGPWAKRLVKKADMPCLEKECREKLSELSELEAEGSSLDRNADCFGRLLGYVCSYGIEDENARAAAEKIGFHTGRWIYIIDASDDFEKDRKAGEYNPLSSFEERPDEFLSCAATLELSNAKNALDTFPAENRAIYEIINNILTLGMPNTAAKIFKENKRDA